MEAVEEQTENSSGDKEEEPAGHRNSKIALVPFFDADPPVFLTDSSGKTLPARARSAEDDFRLAVASLVIGHADQGDDESKPDNEKTKTRAEKDGKDRVQRLNEEEQDGCGKNGFPNSQGCTKQKPAVRATKDQSNKASPRQPTEHLLQKAVTSFDMALGELNQLVHLIDLARAGEFMVLDRVTPSEEDQARALLDMAARPGDGVPRAAIAAMVHLKRVQMKGAADELRQRAKRLRETSTVQMAFQQGVVHLRKNWRIVAPNHGKVNMPLQVGEALSVDCSFGSAGGRAIPFTAAAGTRHRHPWLFHLKCGGGGRLEAEPRKGQRLKAFEVQLKSATTGSCEHSFRTRFPGRESRYYGGTNFSERPWWTNYGVDKSSNDGLASIVQLEKHITRLQNSVFLEGMFETVKAEALIDGKDGWPARQDPRASTDSKHSIKSIDGMVGSKEAEVKSRLVSVHPEGIPRGTVGAAGTRVVHVMDDEVVVEIDNQHLLGYRLVPDGDSISEEGCLNGDVTGTQAYASTVDASGLKASLASLCRLALLYCASIVRQQQCSVEENILSKTNKGKDRQPPVAAMTENGGLVRKTTKGSSWKSVVRVLAHHVFRAEVVWAVASVSRSLHQLGVPFAVRWTHLESTCATSVLTFTLGHCFHFQASLDGGCEVMVTALPGLHNHADQRSLEMRSADDLRQFLLGEACRQIVLTFGDIAAAALSSDEDMYFRIDLVPPAIHLWKEKPVESSPGTENFEFEEKGRGSGWEIRVCPREEGVQIACSNWENPCGASSKSLNGRQGAFSEGWDPDSLNTAPRPTRVTVAEWDGLEGRDIFEKFSSLLKYFYYSRV